RTRGLKYSKRRCQYSFRRYLRRIQPHPIAKTIYKQAAHICSSIELELITSKLLCISPFDDHRRFDTCLQKAEKSLSLILHTTSRMGFQYKNEGMIKRYPPKFLAIQIKSRN